MRPRIVIPTDLIAAEGAAPEKIVLRRPYVEMILAAGALPVPAPPLRRWSPEIADGYGAHAVLLTGGDDMAPSRFTEAPAHRRRVPLHADREQAEFDWWAYAERRALPVLGVCLGMQVINVARGGDLHQYIPDDLPAAGEHFGPGGASVYHDVEATGARLAGLTGGRIERVNSRHKQAVGRVGRGLVVAGRSDDGLIEALEGAGGRWLLAVQWHLEDLPDHPATRAILAGFIAAARERATKTHG